MRCEFGSFNVDGLRYGMVRGSLSLNEAFEKLSFGWCVWLLRVGLLWFVFEFEN